MFFWKRKKKEPDFESKMGELNTTVLSKKDYKNTGKIEQYVVERLEQMIELTKELDDEKEEYRIVTSYLNDIETLEKIPKEERDKISEIAVNVVQLNKARTEFLNSSKKLSDAQFAQLEQQERELPEAIKRFKTNELHRDTLQRDMKYLEREKSEWNLRKEYLDHQQKKLKNVLYIIVGLAVTLAVVFGILQIILEKDFYYAWMGLIFATAVVVLLVTFSVTTGIWSPMKMLASRPGRVMIRGVARTLALPS